jgi:hypothetical protein
MLCIIIVCDMLSDNVDIPSWLYITLAVYTLLTAVSYER